MVKHYINFNINKTHKDSIILIGNFDGLHLGHQKLFQLAHSYKKKYNLKIGVVNFDPMPKMFFNKELKNFRLSNFDQKIKLLSNLEVDFVITKSTLNLLSKLIFCSTLEILKFFNLLLKNILGIGLKLITPIFKLYFFLYDFASLNNF